MRARDLFERNSPAPTALPPAAPPKTPSKVPPGKPTAPPERRPTPTRRPDPFPDPFRPGRIEPEHRPDTPAKMCSRIESRALEVVDALLEVANTGRQHTGEVSAHTNRCAQCGTPLHRGKCTRCARNNSSFAASRKTPAPTI